MRMATGGRVTMAGAVAVCAVAMAVGGCANQRGAQGGDTTSVCVSMISEALMSAAAENGVPEQSLGITDRSQGTAIHVVLVQTSDEVRLPYSAVHLAPAPGSDSGWRTSPGVPDSYEAVKPAAAPDDIVWPDSHRRRSQGSKVATIVGTDPGSEAGRYVEESVDECFRLMR